MSFLWILMDLNEYKDLKGFYGKEIHGLWGVLRVLRDFEGFWRILSYFKTF